MENMNKVELFDQLISICNLFDQNAIRYVIIGGLALGFHNYFRTTMDIDFLIDKKDLEKTKKVLIELKKLVIFHESKEVLQLNGEVDVDILWASRKDAMNILQNAVLKEKTIRVVNVNDLIGLKIQSMNNDPRRKFKDLSDIQILLENNLNIIDWNKIKYYADMFNQWPLIQSIKDDLGYI